MDNNQNRRQTGRTSRPGASGARTQSNGRPTQPARQRTQAGSARQRSRVNKNQRRTPAELSRQRAQRRAAAGQTTRKPTPQPARPTPDVVYTPPKPFNRNRLVLQLATIVAVVLALTFGMSIFFKVENITVSGAEKYSAWTVKEASGIQEGDNLMSFGKIKAAGNIIAKLPYVKNAQIGIKLPDTVNIVIEELDVAYAIQDGNELWWLITAEGRVVDWVDAATAGEYTQVLGVVLADPVAGNQAVAKEQQASDPTDPTAETEVMIPVTVTGAERLNVALSILQYLEGHSLMGLVASVDVTSLENIELWYGQQYLVRLGDTSQLAHKIDWMQKSVSQLQEYDTGLLDISFALLEDQVIYEAFED